MTDADRIERQETTGNAVHCETPMSLRTYMFCCIGSGVNEANTVMELVDTRLRMRAAHVQSPSRLHHG
jgi:hypothetical protein